MKQELLVRSWANACHRTGGPEDIKVLSDHVCVIQTECAKGGVILVNGYPIGGFTTEWRSRILFSISEELLPMPDDYIAELNATILTGAWAMVNEPRLGFKNGDLFIPYVEHIEFEIKQAEILITLGQTDDGKQIVATQQFVEDWKREMGQDLVPHIPDDEIGALFGQDI